MPAKAPASTCQGGPSVTDASAAVPPLAAIVAAVMRPLLKPATSPMNSAVKAKSAPKRFGSPRNAPSAAPAIDDPIQEAGSTAAQANQYAGVTVRASPRRSASAQASSVRKNKPR